MPRRAVPVPRGHVSVPAGWAVRIVLPSGRVRSLHSICAATCVTSQWGDVPPVWWVSPHSTAVRPIGVNGWGAVRAQDRNIGSK